MKNYTAIFQELPTQPHANTRPLTHCFYFFFSSRRRHTRFDCDWSSDVCSSDLGPLSERLRLHDGRDVSADVDGLAHGVHGQSADLESGDGVLSAHDRVKQPDRSRSEEHTSELQSQSNLVCRLLLEKKKNYMKLLQSVLSAQNPEDSPNTALSVRSDTPPDEFHLDVSIPLLADRHLLRALSQFICRL